MMATLRARDMVLITLCSASIPGAALAQAGSASSTAAAAAAPEVADAGEILVTAQRRSERLQDVPMAITALSAETLTKTGVNNTAELAKAVPGVQMTFFGSFLQPAVRGVTSTGANLGENSNVAMYIDGVYQPQQIATLIDLPDVQQVEVLKGPQGALYGQNATGGAILVTSLPPSFTTSGMLSASYGNYNAVNVRGYVTGPISEGIAASISGGYQNRDGFRRNVVTGGRDKGLDAKVVRGKLLFQPSDAAKITVTGYYSDRLDSASYAGIALNNNSIGYALDPTAPKPTSPRQFSTLPGVFTHIKGWGGNVRGEYDTGAGTINSITALTRNRVTYLADADYSPFDFVRATANLNGNYFTQELNFVSRDFGAISFLVGGFYLNGEEIFIHNRATIVPFPAASTDQNARVSKEILAGYAEATLHATDRITLTAGGRYTRERQRAFSDQIAVNGVQTKFANQLEYPRDPVDFSKFTPRVTARYELAPRSNLFASVGRGFKSGVVNTTDFSIAPVKPEVITAYEGGYKGRLFGTLSLNVSGFLYNYKNLQAVAYQPGGGGYITLNAATARIKGIDFDASWAVTPELTLSGGGVILDAKYRSFPNAVSFIPTGFGHITPPSRVDLSGQRLLRSPKFSGNLAANYEHDTTIGRFAAFGSLYHTSTFGLEYTNRIRQKGYTTADAELSFAPAGFEGLRLVLWGKNLGDKDYLASALIAGGSADGVSYAEPRTYGVRAEYKF